jgi:hypothetical protein
MADTLAAAESARKAFLNEINGLHSTFRLARLLR